MANEIANILKFTYDNGEVVTYNNMTSLVIKKQSGNLKNDLRALKCDVESDTQGTDVDLTRVSSIDLTTPDAEGVITFTVTNDDDDPIEGAGVTIDGGAPTLANASGIAVFSDVDVGIDHDYSITMADHTSITDEPFTVDEFTEGIAAQLTRTATVNISVKDALDAGIDGADVTMDSISQGVTAGGGILAIPDVPYGSHDFNASKVNYTSPADATVDVNENPETVPVIELTAV